MLNFAPAKGRLIEARDSTRGDSTLGRWSGCGGAWSWRGSQVLRVEGIRFCVVSCREIHRRREYFCLSVLPTWVWWSYYHTDKGQKESKSGQVRVYIGKVVRRKYGSICSLIVSRFLYKSVRHGVFVVSVGGLVKSLGVF